MQKNHTPELEEVLGQEFANCGITILGRYNYVDTIALLNEENQRLREQNQQMRNYIVAHLISRSEATRARMPDGQVVLAVCDKKGEIVVVTSLHSDDGEPQG